MDREINACGCGIPSKAFACVEFVIGKGDSQTGTETESVTDYTCEDHTPDESNAAQIICPDILDSGWYILESSVTLINKTV